MTIKVIGSETRTFDNTRVEDVQSAKEMFEKYRSEHAYSSPVDEHGNVIERFSDTLTEIVFIPRLAGG